MTDTNATKITDEAPSEYFDRNKKRRAGKIDECVGSNVRNARMLLGITQAQLAKEIGITFQQLQKYENGCNRISAATLCVLSKTLKVPASNFFPTQKTITKKITLHEPKNAILGSQIINNDKEIIQLLDLYSSITSSKTKQKMLSLLEELSSRY